MGKDVIFNNDSNYLLSMLSTYSTCYLNLAYSVITVITHQVYQAFNVIYDVISNEYTLYCFI